MQPEIEAKFLDVDAEALRAALKGYGAELVHPERLMRRRNFDYPDRRLYANGGWVRIRDEGDKVTLSYKQTDEDSLEGTKEVSVVVDDFDKMTDFLLSIGLEQKSYQETRREKWLLDGAEVVIDTWPWIPTFAEVEGQSEVQVRSVADKLALDWDKAMYGGVAPAYGRYYAVDHNEVNAWEIIIFSPVPDWLIAKRK